MAQAVIFIEKTEECFEPLVLKTNHKVLLPFCGIPLIDYTLDILKKNKFAGVTVFCQSHVNEIKAHIRTHWSKEEGYEVTVLDTVHKGSFGEIFQKLDRKKFNQPFLITYGDTVSNVDFLEILKLFATQQNSSCLMQALLKTMPEGELQPRRSSAVVWETMKSNPQMHFGVDGRKTWRTTPEDQRRNGLLVEAAICSPKIFTYCDDFKPEINLQKVMWALQRDHNKIKQPALAIHYLKETEYISRVTSLHKYLMTSQDVLNGHASDYVQQRLEKDGFIQNGAEFRHNTAFVSPSATVHDASMIGEGTHVDRNSRIVNSVIGRGCKIGKNVWIEGAYIGDGSVIHDNARVVFSLLNKGVQVGQDATVMPWCCLGDGVTVQKETTMTCYNWLWKGKKKEEPMETDDEELPGPHEISELWDDLEIDSDDDTEVLGHGLEIEITPETTEDICENFFDFLMMLYEQCLVDKNMLKRCVKELTEMRRAFRLPVRMMARLVTRGVVVMPVRQSVNLGADGYMTEVNKVLSVFKTILEYMIRTRESMQDCRDGIEDAERESPGVITPHHNEIIDMLRTANIINDNTPYLTEPTKEQQEKAYKEKEREKERRKGRRGLSRDSDSEESMQDG